MKLNSEVRAEINKLYDVGELAKDLALQFNVSYPTVMRYLKNHRKQGDKPKVNEEMKKNINILYDNGEKVTYICEMLGICRDTVYKYLRVGV